MKMGSCYGLRRVEVEKRGRRAMVNWFGYISRK